MSSQLSSLLFLVVGLSMAITPWLAAGGQLLASRFEQQDVRSLLPAESEVCLLKSMCQLNAILFNSMYDVANMLLAMWLTMSLTCIVLFMAD